MRDFVKRYPALSLGALAMAIGGILVAPVLAGIAPVALTQLGALSASIAGFVLAGVEGGRPTVRELLRRVLIWRVGLVWWLFALLFPIIPAAVALALAPRFGATVDWSNLAPLYTVVPTLLLLIVFAGLGEEFGWRGFAVPRLQHRHRPLVASLIIGAIHAAWHIPLFFVKGEAYHDLVLRFGFLPPFLGYAVLVLALSVQLVWLFNRTKGSVLLAAVYHGAGNAWNGYLDISRGQMTGLYLYLGLMVVTSAVIVIASASTMLRPASEPATASV
ncbi:MAG: CPBP family intramembrane glutamic endopeptidase [Gemmatimonadales bacterium]